METQAIPSCEHGWEVNGWQDGEPVLGRELTDAELEELANEDRSPVSCVRIADDLFLWEFLGEGAYQRSDGMVAGPAVYIVTD